MSAEPIGIICALPQEIPRLQATVDSPESVSLGPFSADVGLLDDHRVAIVEAGIGKVSTAITATLLIERLGARALLFTGVAGGLDPASTVGDVIVANRAIQHDAGTLLDAGLSAYQAGHLPFFNPTDQFGYPASPDVLARVGDILPTIELPPLSRAAGGIGTDPRLRIGPIVSGDQFVRSERARERLWSDYQALAVEMEGAALAQVAEKFGVPWLIVRALSDLAGAESDIDFLAFADEVAASSEAVVRALLPAFGPYRRTAP